MAQIVLVSSFALAVGSVFSVLEAGDSDATYTTNAGPSTSDQQANDAINTANTALGVASMLPGGAAPAKAGAGAAAGASALAQETQAAKAAREAEEAKEAAKAKKGSACMTAMFTVMSLVQRGMALKGDTETKKNSCAALKKLLVPSATPAVGVAPATTVDASQAQAGSQGSAGAQGVAGIMASAQQCVSPSCVVNGVNLNTILGAATVSEGMAVTAAGGLGTLLNGLPGTDGFVNQVANGDTAGALGGLLDGMGQTGATLKQLAKETKDNDISVLSGSSSGGGGDYGSEGGDSAPSASDLLMDNPLFVTDSNSDYAKGKRDIAGKAVDLNTLDVGALIGILMGPEAGKLDIASIFRILANPQITSEVRALATQILEFKKEEARHIDVFHQKTDRNLFEIISHRISTLTHHWH
jgi:hypothetical protein